MSATTISMTKLSPHVAARIDGIDLSQPTDAATAGALKRAWLDHVVLLFRGQKLSQADLLRVTEVFGPVGPLSRPKAFRPAGYDSLLDNIMLISNIRENGKPIGALPDGEMMFHHDMIHRPTPHSGTLLYSVEVPSVGGNTLFANMHTALERLPQEIRAKLEERKARHYYQYGSVQRRDANNQSVPASAEAMHPVIRTHEENGRKALYVNRLMTEEIVGLPREESDALLQYLFDHCENPEWIYEHVWQPGDLVIWDNRNSMHARTDFSEGERRLMLRTTVASDVVPY